MKRLFVAIALLLLGALAWAQTYLYEPLTAAPAAVDFPVKAEDLICATLLSPGAVPSEGVSLDDLTPPSNCPSAPPVVVWGLDSESGDAVYAVLIRVRFWGERFYWNRSTGIDRLILELKNNYGLDISASGGVSEVDAQLLPPLVQPPVDQPPATDAGWVPWGFSQSVSMDDPEVSDETNYWFSCPYADDLGSTCWSAVFTWALPVRLVVHGGERGSFQVTIAPESFSLKTASTLNVSGGELVRPRMLPFGK